MTGGIERTVNKVLETVFNPRLRPNGTRKREDDRKK